MCCKIIIISSANHPTQMVAINLIGNSLVCLVVLKDKTMRTPMNFLLVNLAVSDIIVGIFSTFRLASEFR